MILKKRLIAVVCAAALALALPTLAWANPSPGGSTFPPGSGIWGGGIPATIGISLVSFDGMVDEMDFAQVAASNVPDGATIHFSCKLKGNATNLNLKFLASQAAGKTVTVFIEHDDGTFEQKVAQVAEDGTFSIHSDRLSLFTVVIGDYGNISAPDPNPIQPGAVISGEGGGAQAVTLATFEGTVESVSFGSTPSSNVPSDATVIDTIEIKGDATDLDLQFLVDAKYAGKKVTVFIEHDNGDLEQKVATVGADGSFSIHVDRLSSFSIVLGDYGTSSNANAADAVKKIDPTAKSPKTNADLGGVTALTALMALAAGAAFIGLRKAAAK